MPVCKSTCVTKRPETVSIFLAFDGEAMVIDNLPLNKV